MVNLNEVYRRLRLLMTFARILRVDDSGELQTIQLEGFLGEVRDGVPRIGEFGFASNPPADSQAVVLALGARRGQLVVIGTEDRRERPADLPEGASEVYAAGGTRIRVNPDGSILIEGDSVAITVSAAADIVAGGEVNISGSVVRIGPATEIDGIGFLTHTHVSASPGSPSSVPSGPGIP